MYLNLFTTILLCLLLNSSLCAKSTLEIDRKLKGVTIRTWPYADKINDKYEGFAIDLIDKIANIVGFEYEMYFTPDGYYGILQENNTFNGMLGEVINKRADFAIADITVTNEREKYVDFTEPLVETSIAFLIHKENLNNMSSFSDLANQSDITYGTYKKGSTMSFFSKSTDDTIHKMYTHMSTTPGVLVKNSREGLEKVRTSRYAFLLESSLAEFLSEMYCELTYIVDQNKYINRQYAIAMPKGSPFRTQFNTAIKQLKASGELAKLKAKYWRDRCDKSSKNINNP